MVPQDYTEAVRWYQSAADEADLDSQFRLRNCYELGRGASQDYVAAYKWYNLAAALGHKRAIEARDKVASQMNPWQITEGQKGASEAYASMRTNLVTGRDTTDRLKQALQHSA